MHAALYHVGKKKRQFFFKGLNIPTRESDRPKILGNV